MSLLPRLACAARRVRAPLLTRAASTSSAATGDAGAEQRTHQYIGRHQQLFTIHESSPGAPFFLEHGMRILHRLQEELRYEYRMRGFHEVMTPLVFDDDLWRTSGHWAHYQENMFRITGAGSAATESASEGGRSLKPMNCPAHCLLFASQPRSFRELPLRLAEFSPLHRNEARGALTGLTRVRQFHQDDAHIFCTLDQVDAEIADCLSFVDTMYSAFGFTWSAVLSTTPPLANDDAMAEDLRQAESALKSALQKHRGNISINEGDGAFYAPKIDFYISDALGRKHQTATIQLDFVLPRRFGLAYTDATQQQVQPVIIHRAVCGSLERMLAILIEHTGGRWPFWLSPRQVILIPVHPQLNIEPQRRQLLELGYHVAVDCREEGLSKRVRDAQLARHNFMFVLGENELRDGTVSVRPRDQQLAEKSDAVNNPVHRQLLQDMATLPAGAMAWSEALMRLAQINRRPGRPPLPAA